MSIARISSKYVIESPQSLIWSSQIIFMLFCLVKFFDWKITNKLIFLKICFKETPKGKTNESMIIRMVRAFHPINNWISIFARLGNTIRRRHYDHICLIIIAWPCASFCQQLQLQGILVNNLLCPTEGNNRTSTGRPVKYGRVVLVPSKKWLVKCSYKKSILY